MAYRPTPAGPRNTREMFHYLWRELTRVGKETDGGGNTTSNLPGGEGLAAPKDGVTLPFKSLVAGPNVTLTATVDTITIDAEVNQFNIDGGLSDSIYNPPPNTDGGGAAG